MHDTLAGRSRVQYEDAFWRFGVGIGHTIDVEAVPQSWCSFKDAIDANKYQTPIVEDVTRDTLPQLIHGTTIAGFSEVNDLKVNEACHHGSWGWRSNQTNHFRSTLLMNRKSCRTRHPHASATCFLCNEPPFLVKETQWSSRFYCLQFTWKSLACFLVRWGIVNKVWTWYVRKSSMLWVERVFQPWI